MPIFETWSAVLVMPAQPTAGECRHKYKYQKWHNCKKTELAVLFRVREVGACGAFIITSVALKEDIG